MKHSINIYIWQAHWSSSTSLCNTKPFSFFIFQSHRPCSIFNNINNVLSATLSTCWLSPRPSDCHDDYFINTTLMWYSYRLWSNSPISYTCVFSHDWNCHSTCSLTIYCLAIILSYLYLSGFVTIHTTTISTSATNPIYIFSSSACYFVPTPCYVAASYFWMIDESISPHSFTRIMTVRWYFIVRIDKRSLRCRRLSWIGVMTFSMLFLLKFYLAI